MGVVMLSTWVFGILQGIGQRANHALARTTWAASGQGSER